MDRTDYCLCGNSYSHRPRHNLLHGLLKNAIEKVSDYMSGTFSFTSFQVDIEVFSIQGAELQIKFVLLQPIEKNHHDGRRF